MGVAITEIKKECYACGTTKTKSWIANRDLVTWMPMDYLCQNCYNRLLMWPKYFRDPVKRIRHRETCKRESGKRRAKLIALLGGKCMCNEKDCWHEGPCNLMDIDILQIEHKNGGGNLQYKTMGPLSVYLYYIEHPEERERDIQLHCANCNWKKKARRKEHKTKIVEASTQVLPLHSN